MICCTYNTAEVRVPIKHILLSSALLKNNFLSVKSNMRKRQNYNFDVIVAKSV